VGPFFDDSTFTVTLPEKDYSDVYALLKGAKAASLLYTADKTFPNAVSGETVKIHGVRIQSDMQAIGT